jgi:hypothetical protein
MFRDEGVDLFAETAGPNRNTYPGIIRRPIHQSLVASQSQSKHLIPLNQLGSLRPSACHGLPLSRAGAVKMRQSTDNPETERQILLHLYRATGRSRLLKQGLRETLGWPHSISLPEFQAVRSGRAGQMRLHFRAVERCSRVARRNLGGENQIRSNSEQARDSMAA